MHAPGRAIRLAADIGVPLWGDGHFKLWTLLGPGMSVGSSPPAIPVGLC